METSLSLKVLGVTLLYMVLMKLQFCMSAIQVLLLQAKQLSDMVHTGLRHLVTRLLQIREALTLKWFRLVQITQAGLIHLLPVRQIMTLPVAVTRIPAMIRMRL